MSKLTIYSDLGWHKHYMNQIRQQIAETRDNPDVSESYRAKKLEELQAQLDAHGRQAYDAISKSIQDTRTRTQADFEAQKAHGDYPSRLSSALQILELGGAGLDFESIKQTVKPFALDKIAMAAFKGALERGGHTSAEVTLKAVYDGERMKRKYEDLLTVARKALVNPTANEHGMNLDFAQLEFTLGYWNDDMTECLFP